MDDNRSSSPVGMLGPQRIPAAILLLWGNLFGFVSVAYGGALPYMDVFWWLSLFIRLSLVILLFIGRKSVGILIPVALYPLLFVVELFADFSIESLLYTAIWAVLCLIAMASVIPELGLKKPLLKGLAYLPAGLNLAVGALFFISDLASEWFTPADVLYGMNYVIWPLSLLFLAKALVETSSEGASLPIQTGGSVYRTYSQPVFSQQPVSAPAPVPAAAVQRTAPGILLVRFSIDRLNELSGPYGFQSGRLIGRAVPASLLEGMVVSDGDSAATLAGREYVCIVAIASGDSSILKEKIEPLILASGEIRACGAIPLTQLVGSTSEPLVMDGVIRNGAIEGPGGWCANGLASVWKEAAAQQQRPAPAADKPQQAAPAPAAPAVDKKEIYLQKSVERLLALYRQVPGGFPRDEAVDVRAIGMLLDEAGGMDLMRQAHGLFARQNPGMARNLESVWDGIGNWMG